MDRPAVQQSRLGSGPDVGHALSGVFAAIVTPFDRHDGIDRGALRRLLDYQIAAGVDGVYVGGTTGEGLLQDVKTRVSVLETVVDHLDGRGVVIAHIAALRTDDAIILAREAKTLRVTAMAAIPPLFYARRVHEVRRYYEEILAAADLPLLIYHIPALTGTALTLDELVGLLELPGIAGIKFSDYNLYLLERLVRRVPQAAVFSGNDECFVPALAAGASGAIGLTLNFMPNLFVRMYRAYAEGDLALASALQTKANDVIEVVVRAGAIAACKAALQMLDLDCGETRHPLLGLDDDQRDDVRRALDNAGILVAP